VLGAVTLWLIIQCSQIDATHGALGEECGISPIFTLVLDEAPDVSNKPIVFVIYAERVSDSM
jgi:hypothetical protein